MWQRAELKSRGKAALLRNYWKCVLVALILMLLLGSGAGSAGRDAVKARESSVPEQELQQLEHEFTDAGDTVLERAFFQSLTGMVSRVERERKSNLSIALGGSSLIMLALSIMVFNPLIVGCRRFFLMNSRGGAEIGELGYGFGGNWGNVMLTMFLRNLFLILWSLLFVIPGIVKAYSYRLVPYLLAEHPELSGTQAITLSRQMMNGHKGRAFVLDLSFLGWILLSALTLGIMGVFYVNPYIHATDAELYEAVKAAQQGR